MYPELTKRTRATLVALHAFLEEHGYGPTFAELSARLGIASPSVVTHITRLEDLGLLVRRVGPGGRTKPRGLELTARGAQIARGADVGTHDALPEPRMPDEDADPEFVREELLRARTLMLRIAVELLGAAGKVES